MPGDEGKSSATTELNEQVFVEAFGLDWAQGRATRMDFSGPQYALESLGGGRGDAGFGLLHPRLQRDYFLHIDVSCNKLMNIDLLSEENGFKSLQFLKCRRNMITRPQIKLSRLLELNLSWNEIASLPNLWEDLPSLEVLILNHNRLSGSFEDLGKCTRLTRLELSDNKFELRPSELGAGFNKLSRCKNLKILALKRNPFENWFPQYRVFAVKIIKTLKRLDDFDLDIATKTAVEERSLANIDRFDDVVADAMEAWQRENSGQAPEGLVEPSFIDWKEQVEEARHSDSSVVDAARNAQRIVRSLVTKHRATDDPSRIEGTWWTGNSDMSDVLDALEGVQQLIERHESTRDEWMQQLAQLGRIGGPPSLAGGPQFGARCLRILGGFLSGGSSLQSLAAQYWETNALAEVSKSFEALSALAKQLKYDLDECGNEKRVGADKNADIALLQNVINMVVRCPTASLVDIASSIARDPRVLLFTEAADLLRVAVQADVGVAKRLLEECNLKELEDVLRKVLNIGTSAPPRPTLWLHAATVAAVLVRLEPHIAERFQKERLSVKVLSLMRKTHNGKLELMESDQRMARTCAAQLDLVCATMRQNKQVMQDACESYHIVSDLIQALKLRACDPMFLSAVIDCVAAIMEKGVAPASIQQLMTETGHMTQILSYLGKDTKYPLCLAMAENHRLAKEGLNVLPLDANPQVVPLSACTNPIMHKLFISIVELIHLLVRLAEQGDEAAAEACSEMNSQNREKTLLGLLNVPSGGHGDHLRSAVMSCLGSVSLAELDREEIALLLRVLSTSRSVGAGNTEEILGKTINLLLRILLDEGETGVVFRDELSAMAIGEVHGVLLRCAERDTADSEQEEKEKLELCRICVRFVGAASQIPSLRRQLDGISEGLPQLLHLEERLLRPQSIGVPIEQTWPGRHLENLLFCTRGRFRLNPCSREAARILMRIADVCQGLSDRIRDPVWFPDLEDLCARERTFWRPDEMLRLMTAMDASERRERQEKVETFVAGNGILSLVEFLGKVQPDEEEKGLSSALADAAAFQELALRQLSDGREAERERRIKELEDTRIQVFSVDKDEQKGPAGNVALRCAEDYIPPPVDKAHYELFVARPHELEYGEEVWDDEEGVVRPGYGVSAMLRCFYSILQLSPPPKTTDVRELANRQLRTPQTLLKVIAVVCRVPLLRCHVASKFLRLATSLLATSPRAPAADASTLQLLFLVATFVDRVCGPLLQLLRGGSEAQLSHAERLLGAEAARCALNMCRAIDALELEAGATFEENAKIRKTILERLLPPGLMATFVSMAIHELVTDQESGAAKTDAEQTGSSERDTQDADSRGPCLELLAHYLVRCPEHRYDVLESFVAAEVFENRSVRASFVADLLRAIALGTFGTHVASLLQAPGHEYFGSDAERMVCFHEAYLNGGSAPVVLMISNEALYVLQPSLELPPWSSDAIGAVWEPIWEWKEPRDPRVFRREPVEGNVSELFHSEDEHLVVVNFRESSAKIPNPAIGNVGPLKVLFRARAHSREFLNVLHQMSAKLPTARTPISVDPRSKADLASLFPKGGILLQELCVDDAGHPRLCVITDKDVNLVPVFLNSWTQPSPEQVEQSGLPSVEELLTIAPGDAGMSTSERKEYEERVRERAGLRQETGAKAKKGEATTVLGKPESATLSSIQEVEIHSDSDRPMIKLGDKITMKFYTDGALGAVRSLLSRHNALNSVNKRK